MPNGATWAGPFEIKFADRRDSDPYDLYFSTGFQPTFDRTEVVERRFKRNNVEPVSSSIRRFQLFQASSRSIFDFVRWSGGFNMTIGRGSIHPIGSHEPRRPNRSPAESISGRRTKVEAPSYLIFDDELSERFRNPVLFRPTSKFVSIKRAYDIEAFNGGRKMMNQDTERPTKRVSTIARLLAAGSPFGRLATLGVLGLLIGCGNNNVGQVRGIGDLPVVSDKPVKPFDNGDPVPKEQSPLRPKPIAELTKLEDQLRAIPPEFKIQTLKEGSGEPAIEGDVVDTRYTGRLVDGKVFDSNVSSTRKAYSFRLGDENGAIIGVQLGVLNMKVGEKRKLMIPPEFGYGLQAFGPVPANSTLDFEIELVRNHTAEKRSTVPNP